MILIKNVLFVLGKLRKYWELPLWILEEMVGISLIIGEKTMNYRAKILENFPDAVILKDNHNYGGFLKSTPNFILVHKLPQNLQNKVKNDIIEVDYHSVWPTKIATLSSWKFSVDDCWTDAWKTVQNKMVSIFEK